MERSVLVLTRPQVRLGEAETRLQAARQAPLPEGPTAWPTPPQAEDEDLAEEELAEEEVDEVREAITAKADEEA